MNFDKIKTRLKKPEGLSILAFATLVSGTFFNRGFVIFSEHPFLGILLMATGAPLFMLVTYAVKWLLEKDGFKLDSARPYSANSKEVLILPLSSAPQEALSSFTNDIKIDPHNVTIALRLKPIIESIRKWQDEITSNAKGRSVKRKWNRLPHLLYLSHHSDRVKRIYFLCSVDERTSDEKEAGPLITAHQKTYFLG